MHIASDTRGYIWKVPGSRGTHSILSQPNSATKFLNIHSLDDCYRNNDENCEKLMTSVYYVVG